MSIFSFFAVAVMAAETIISPVPDDVLNQINNPKPSISFGQLIATPPITQIPEITTVTPVQVIPEPTAPPRRTHKSNYTIAVIGDSMVDTLGPGIPALKNKLSNFYPGTGFNILNYGVGATNIIYGLERLTHDYDYLGNHIASLVSRHPDIVVVESFGYNPIPNANLDTQWLTMANIINTLKEALPGVKIAIAATIAPNSKIFGDAAGLNFNPQDKQERTGVIKQYIENAIHFAQSQHLPLADSYHPSLNGNDGNPAYINAGDGIHPSEQGRVFFAKKVTEAIEKNHLLE